VGVARSARGGSPRRTDTREHRRVVPAMTPGACAPRRRTPAARAPARQRSRNPAYTLRSRLCRRRPRREHGSRQARHPITLPTRFSGKHRDRRRRARRNTCLMTVPACVRLGVVVVAHARASARPKVTSRSCRQEAVTARLANLPLRETEPTGPDPESRRRAPSSPRSRRSREVSVCWEPSGCRRAAAAPPRRNTTLDRTPAAEHERREFGGTHPAAERSVDADRLPSVVANGHAAHQGLGDAEVLGPRGVFGVSHVHHPGPADVGTRRQQTLHRDAAGRRRRADDARRVRAGRVSVSVAPAVRARWNPQ